MSETIGTMIDKTGFGARLLIAPEAIEAISFDRNGQATVILKSGGAINVPQGFTEDELIRLDVARQRAGHRLIPQRTGPADPNDERGVLSFIMGTEEPDRFDGLHQGDQ